MHTLTAFNLTKNVIFRQRQGKKAPTEARICDGGWEEVKVGKAGQNSHLNDMIYNKKATVIQKNKKKPPLTWA